MNSRPKVATADLREDDWENIKKIEEVRYGYSQSRFILKNLRENQNQPIPVRSIPYYAVLAVNNAFKRYKLPYRLLKVGEKGEYSYGGLYAHGWFNQRIRLFIIEPYNIATPLRRKEKWLSKT